MTQTESSYVLLANELGAIRTFVQFQQTWNQSKITNLTDDDVGHYYTWVSNLSGTYDAVQNATWKGWCDSLFNKFVEQKTNDLADFAEYYVVWQYPLGILAIQTWRKGLPNPWKSWWDTFWTGSYLSIPDAPATWQAAVKKVADKWGDTPPGNLIAVGPSFDDPLTPQTFEYSVLANWKDSLASIAGQANTAISDEQRTTFNALLKQTTLTADAYFFLLHLLISLPTGDPSAKFSTLGADSQEYPNDTFVNQLIYVVLLHLSDPVGSYGWNNAQLQEALQELGGVIVASDPLSTAIKASLGNHIKVLVSDSAYPMQDPYSPTFGFTQRKTDTLSALDKAREKVVPG